VWGIAAAFYLVAFYVRVSPAVMTAELMRDFSISAKQMGSLSAVYFYAYVLMQIPTGILVDSWGARKLLVLGCLSAATGTFLFPSTGSFAVACIARGVVGGSTAVAWVVTLKLLTHWFPSRRFAVLSGLSLFIGNIGALVAQVPLRLLVEEFSWRRVAVASGLVILIISAIAFLAIRNDPSDLGYRSYARPALQNRHHASIWELVKGFKQILGYRNTWLIFFAQGGFLGPLLAFAGLWGSPYLRARFGITSTRAAAVCSVMIACWATASPIFGYLSDRIGRRKSLYLGGALASALGWFALFYFSKLPLSGFIGIAALTSFSAGVIIIGFPYSKDSVPEQYLATITGATNMGNMLGPTLLQPAIGWILDEQWSGETVNGLRLYSVGAFNAGFLLIIAWAMLSCVLISFTKETYCKPYRLDIEERATTETPKS
jgi:MFS family permease